MKGPLDRDYETWPPVPTGQVAVEGSLREPQTWATRLANAPQEVVLFAVFSAAVSVSELWLTFVGPKSWRETLVPFTGGTGVMPYLTCLYFALQMVFAAKSNPKFRRVIIGLLLLGSVFGAGRFLTRPSINYHNPYLTFSPWQPVWTVALPMIWAIVLGSCPAIRSWRSRNHQTV